MQPPDRRGGLNIVDGGDEGDRRNRLVSHEEGLGQQHSAPLGVAVGLWMAVGSGGVGQTDHLDSGLLPDAVTSRCRTCQDQRGGEFLGEGLERGPVEFSCWVDDC